MMKNRLIMGYHFERHREKLGKVTIPESFIFEHLINAYLRDAEVIEDVILVPITINYDKVYEGDAFPFELLGEEKPKETLLKLIKHLLISKESLGKVQIKYCKPMSLKSLIENYASKQYIDTKMIENSVIHEKATDIAVWHKQQFIKGLQKEIIYTLSENSMVMATSMVSSILLIDRNKS